MPRINSHLASLSHVLPTSPGAAEKHTQLGTLGKSEARAEQKKGKKNNLTGRRSRENWEKMQRHSGEGICGGFSSGNFSHHKSEAVTAEHPVPMTSCSADLVRAEMSAN